MNLYRDAWINDRNSRPNINENLPKIKFNSTLQFIIQRLVESSTVAFQALNIAISKDDNLKSAAIIFKMLVQPFFRKARNTVSNLNDLDEINVKIKKFIEVEESFITFFRYLSQNKYAPENFEKKVATKGI
ncbi:4022_t:CDS:2 [Gigaspora margarita]|uniref:4022_t:CDS:1 n=1 Tax=Gigaspora margarita TaxID=4874 RepID=A0ABN7U9N2_GIGMA|nr:4022_t:CDS:2 [Gigaspora margarita]